MNEPIIDNELAELCFHFEKKIKRMKLFNPAKTANVNGNLKTTFNIGGPGKSTAIGVTLLVFIAGYMSTLSISYWFWLFYSLIAVLVIPFILKMDKAFQVRIYAMSLAMASIEVIKISSDKAGEDKIDLVLKAEKQLNDASKYIYEPSIERQLTNFNVFLKENKPC